MHAKQPFVIVLALLGCSTSQAASSTDSDAWKFEVTPYIFAAGLDGTMGIHGVTTKVNASFGDLLKNLDQGFMGEITATKGPWTYGFEAVYMKLSDQGSRSVTGPFGQVGVKGALSVTSSMYIYQGSVGYRVLDSTAKVDLIGALRYTKVATSASVSIATTPAIVFPGGAKSDSGSVSWTDAVIGFRAIYPVTDTVSLVGYADVGGGGSDLTYQFIVGANWEFAKDFTVKAGYRQLYWDYNKNGTVWNMTARGPYLGLGIRF